MGVGVVQGVLVSLGAPRLADGKVRVADGGFDQRRLMAGGGGKEDLAACLRQFLDGVGAGVVLRDVGAHQDLGVIVNPQGLAGGLQALDVVLVIGILLLPRQKQADLDGVCGGGGFGVPLILAAGGQGEEKGSG